MKPIIRKVRKASKYSYDIIIPKKIVDKLGLADSYVAISVEGDKLVIKKVDTSKLF